jgi:hypothetical protein
MVASAVRSSPLFVIARMVVLAFPAFAVGWSIGWVLSVHVIPA